MTNNCDHCIDSPVWFSQPESHGKRPPVIALLDKKLQNYYSRPAYILPSLNLSNGSDRQQRSERREACIRLICTMLHYLDLKSMRVGVPTEQGQFTGLNMEYLASLANLSLRRAERAMQDLKASGLVKVYPICEKLTDCSYKGFAAIRTLSEKLFKVFGLRKKLKKNRDRASRNQTNESEQAKVELMQELTYKPVMSSKDHISNMKHALDFIK